MLFLNRRLIVGFSIAALFSVLSTTVTADSVDKETKRAKQRAAYLPVKLPAATSSRQVIDLSGDWLFKPLHEMEGQTGLGGNPAADDRSWHVLGVPQFWGVQDWAKIHSNTSYNHYFRELERCGRFTFDHERTSSGWYRQWIDVPESMRNKRFVLKFNGVAMISQVYWNGKPVGGHVGMYGPFECEVTDHVRPGKPNLLAVYVIGGRKNKADGEVESVMVTVQVTKEMLNTLPDGYFFGVTGGIWQAVRLEVTNKDRIADVFFNPDLTGAVIQTTVDRKSSSRLAVRHALVDSTSNTVLYSGKPGKPVAAKTGSHVIQEEIAGLKPKLWSPEHPNLYRLKTQLIADGKVVDEVVNTVGFRTFEARDSKFYLNGKPYYLRGTNTPPIGLAPSDKAVADKIMKLMHDGNQMVTRFHCTPVGHIWLDAADKYGVGVSMEAHWPWVLHDRTDIPSRELIDAWQQETIEIVRANRNHPSVLLWTLGNENYFAQPGRDPDLARRTEKYRIFSDLAKAVRKTMPRIPIVLFSGYNRLKGEYENIIKPNNFDDGDVNDRHAYDGWYGKSVLHMDIAKKYEEGCTDFDMPLISQEHAIPYTNMDTGGPMLSQNYCLKATAWIGDRGSLTARPDCFLETQALIGKETAEKIRREGNRIAGWLYFCTYTWIRNAYDAETMAPFPIYWEMKKALQPVLVTLMNNNRHFMAGEKFSSEVVVVNDDPDKPMLKDLTLEWRVRGLSLTDTTSGITTFPDCPYYSKSRKLVEFEIPQNLPFDRSEMVLELVLTSGGEVVSRNTYNILCGTSKWVSVEEGMPELMVLEKEPGASSYLSTLGAKCRSVSSIDWRSLSRSTCVVIAEGFAGSEIGNRDDFAAFVQEGGRVLMLSPRLPSDEATPKDSLLGAIPGFQADQVSFESIAGEYVDVQSPALADGIDAMDTRWFNAAPGNLVRVCSIGYNFPDGLPGATKLVKHTVPQGGAAPPKFFSWPVFEVQSDKGRVIVSSILLAEDPVAKRLMRNTLEYLTR